MDIETLAEGWHTLSASERVKFGLLTHNKKKNQSHAHLRPAVKAYMEKNHSATARELADAKLIPLKPNGKCWTVTELWNNILIHIDKELPLKNIRDGKYTRYHTSKYVREDEEAKPPFNTVNEAMISHIINALDLDSQEKGYSIDIKQYLDNNRSIYPAFKIKKNRPSIKLVLKNELAKHNYRDVTGLIFTKE